LCAAKRGQHFLLLAGRHLREVERATQLGRDLVELSGEMWRLR
jgi:hypothetical protein